MNETFTNVQIFRYENTDKSALYTYDVDVCFAAVLAAKLGFPWIYEYITGNNCKRVYTGWLFTEEKFSLFSVFQAVGLVSRSGQDYYGDYSSEDLSDFSSPSFSEKASELFQEMGKAVHRDPNPYSSVNRYNRVPKQF